MEKDQLTEFCLDIHWSPTRAWPWLHHMTSAFAPEYYPKAFVDYANTGGADKIMYAGYYPMGLSLDRIFSELPDVPFRDEVWPLYLREDARGVINVYVAA